MTKRAFTYPSTLDTSVEGSIVPAVATYMAGVAVVGWIDIGVLCRGDVKWGRCGFAELDIAVSLVLLAPALLAGLMAAREHAFLPWRGRLYMVAAAATLAVAICVHAFSESSLGFVAVMFGAGVVFNVVRATGWWLMRDRPAAAALAGPYGRSGGSFTRRNRAPGIGRRCVSN